jgi:SAM-dependent methyltransferase
MILHVPTWISIATVIVVIFVIQAYLLSFHSELETGGDLKRPASSNAHSEVDRLAFVVDAWTMKPLYIIRPISRVKVIRGVANFVTESGRQNDLQLHNCWTSSHHLYSTSSSTIDHHSRKLGNTIADDSQSSTTDREMVQQHAAPDSPSVPTRTKTKTRYTIDDTVCPPTRPHVLRATVEKACENFDVYQTKKPFATHTVDAYNALVERIMSQSDVADDSNNNETIIVNSRPVVLDSGCGTGRSTKFLAKRFPDHWVVGVDRSFVRITRNNGTGISSAPSDMNEESMDDRDSVDEGLEIEEQDADASSVSSERAYCQQVARNAFLVRAELVDFWRCCYQDLWQQNDNHIADDSGPCETNNNTFQWNITHHYVLYPNPYPTNQRLTQRWYAHPSFPLLMKLGSQKIVIRSNWEGYLKEFATAIQIGHECYDDCDTFDEHKKEQQSNKNPMSRYVESARRGPVERQNKTVALTNFEAKYDKIGESTYELVLRSSTQTTS